jgi:hypothetical protein
MENNMKNIQSITAAAAFLAAFGCASALASIDEVWQCTLNEGKTLAEVQAANNAWVKYVNSKVMGGGVSSATVVPVVADQAGFMFVDSFPSMQAWIDTKAVMATSEGQKMEASILDTATCTANRLYEMTEQTGG